ncbi:predicted protein [Naegleria gruberi]|uniref:Predicted protein n=1 Tax=Naegleria gruberi TaxID=5762 RepID=D2VSQ3_NAEGR|nr:uncharacterized protein NAEGRDRAFT_72022 [Naegleria gruberi]EFC40232.1 predicted protein [Naegleria gruberi]|eukprot:XP_002672976.1 predicted protein [Naegleria gruberi strain NEG-M]
MKRFRKGSAAAASSPSLQDCKSVIGASYGKTNVTQYFRFLQENKAEFNMVMNIKNVECFDDLNTIQRALVLVVEDERNELWYEIFSGEFSAFATRKITKSLNAHTCKKHGIQVVLAVYGLLECTQKVADIFDKQTGNELTVHASNSVFGDPWPNVFKSFTLVYRVKLQSGQWSEPRVKVCEEHALLRVDIIEELNSSIVFEANSPLSSIVRKRRHEAVNKEVCKYVPQDGINILAATYGPEDVTEKVKEFLNTERTFLRVEATNNTFGDTWAGVIKYLVVYYTIDKDDEIYVASKIEHQTLTISKHNTDHIICASNESNTNRETNFDMIRIHGAMAGDSNRTFEMRTYFENNEGAEKLLRFNEGQYEHSKCLIMLYSFGASPFKLFIARNGEEKSLFETKSKFASIYIENNKDSIVTVHQNYRSNINQMYINLVKNEILIKSNETKVYIQSWKSGEQILKDHKNSKIVSSGAFVKHLMEGKCNVRGPLMTVENEKSKFLIPLFELTSADMRRKHLPQIIRNNLVHFLDETIPDQPGLSKFTSHTLFSLTDISLHFQQ